MQNVDFIIVGGGIAGSLLALQIMQRGMTVALFDDPNSGGASDISAGSINPITGRRFVKSWNIDTLLDYVNDVYGAIEEDNDIAIRHKYSVIRGIKTTGMQNDWSARMIDPDYSNYINNTEPVQCPNGINNSYVDFAEIQGACRIDFEIVRDIVKRSDFYVSERFDINQIVWNEGHNVYDDQISFRHIIFCEGSAVRNNALWNWLPFVPARGERLIIHAPELKLYNVFNDGKMIVPLGDDQYWVGTTNDWEVLEPVATEKGMQQLKDHLDRTLRVTYTIIDHSGRVKPASHDRRPYVGRHPELSTCYILNGLGSKGASLAPYCVEQLLDYVLAGADLDAEIDVGRVGS